MVGRPSLHLRADRRPCRDGELPSRSRQVRRRLRCRWGGLRVLQRDRRAGSPFPCPHVRPRHGRSGRSGDRLGGRRLFRRARAPPERRHPHGRDRAGLRDGSAEPGPPRDGDRRRAPRFRFHRRRRRHRDRGNDRGVMIIEPSCSGGGRGMTCINPRGHGAFRVFPHPTWSALAIVVAATIAAHVAARAQGLDVKRYNPSEWTKGRFSEVVTVTGAGTIYLALVGAEDENAPAGASAPIRHLGNPYEQCRYAYDKIKRLLATHGASLADAVKQVVYVTDVRFQADVAKCRREAYGDGPIPANTFLVINALAIPGMLLEIDVTAVVGK